MTAPSQLIGVGENTDTRQLTSPGRAPPNAHPRRLAHRIRALWDWWARTACGGMIVPREPSWQSWPPRFSARGSVMYFKAMAEQDSGDLSLMERTLPVGGRRPPPHRHTNCSEAYFVLDGLVSVTVEDQELRVGPDGFVLVPRGTAHTFGNAAGSQARLLVIHAPAMDAYFAALHELWHRDQAPSPDEEQALMARFGMEKA
jgi:mannose-6-phosphate isomerase-like protein (cupin superfamily)